MRRLGDYIYDVRQGSTSTDVGSPPRPVIGSLARIDGQKFYARVGGVFLRSDPRNENRSIVQEGAKVQRLGVS